MSARRLAPVAAAALWSASPFALADFSDWPASVELSFERDPAHADTRLNPDGRIVDTPDPSTRAALRLQPKLDGGDVSLRADLWAEWREEDSISDGGRVTVTSRVGSVTTDVLATDDVDALIDLRGLDNLRGRHNWQNIAVAYAAVRALGLSPAQAIAGLPAIDRPWTTDQLATARNLLEAVKPSIMPEPGRRAQMSRSVITWPAGKSWSATMEPRAKRYTAISI